MAFDWTSNLITPFGASTNPQYSAGVGQVVASAPMAFSNNIAQMYDSFNKGYGTYNQGLGQLGNSFANNYAAMAGGIGSLANALGNTWNNAQAANQAASAAEVGRQTAIANLGTAAMANYGNTAGKALEAWSQNQNGYQRSLSDLSNGNQQALAQLGSSNQQAVSQLGQGRYNALANLGQSGAKMNIGQNIARLIPGMTGGGTQPVLNSDVLAGLRQDIADARELNALSGGYANGRAELSNNYRQGLESLNNDQRHARQVPRELMGDAFDAIRGTNDQNLRESALGMDQFYRYADQNGPRSGQTIPTQSLLDALSGGYSDSANRISGVVGNMNSGWQDALATYKDSLNKNLNLYDISYGNAGFFNSPIQNQRMQWAMEDAAKQRRALQRQPVPGTPVMPFPKGWNNTTSWNP